MYFCKLGFADLKKQIGTYFCKLVVGDLRPVVLVERAVSVKRARHRCSIHSKVQHKFCLKGVPLSIFVEKNLSSIFIPCKLQSLLYMG